MPMDRKRYPKDWKQIAFEIKQEADWKCEEWRWTDDKQERGASARHNI